MPEVSFTNEELRVFHKACREGRVADVAKAKVSRNMLDTRAVTSGRTVSLINTLYVAVSPHTDKYYFTAVWRRLL